VPFYDDILKETLLQCELKKNRGRHKRVQKIGQLKIQNRKMQDQKDERTENAGLQRQDQRSGGESGKRWGRCHTESGGPQNAGLR